MNNVALAVATSLVLSLQCAALDYGLVHVIHPAPLRRGLGYRLPYGGLSGSPCPPPTRADARTVAL